MLATPGEVQDRCEGKVRVLPLSGCALDEVEMDDRFVSGGGRGAGVTILASLSVLRVVTKLTTRRRGMSGVFRAHTTPTTSLSPLPLPPRAQLPPAPSPGRPCESLS